MIEMASSATKRADIAIVQIHSNKIFQYHDFEVKNGNWRGMMAKKAFLVQESSTDGKT